MEEDYKRKLLVVHGAWLMITVAAVVLVSWFYGRTISGIQERYIQENESAAKVAELALNQSNQLVDGRAKTELPETESNIWQEDAVSPAPEWQQVSYRWGEAVVRLSSGVIWRDGVTGMVWSAPSDRAVNNLVEINGGRVTGTGAVGFCELLARVKYGGYDDWALPTQTQLMQAYIDGAAGKLIDHPYYFWSATEFYGDSNRAWRVNLAAGDVVSAPKTNESSGYAICVARGN